MLVRNMLVTKNNKPIWWYTRECFTYHMVNKALGTLQVGTVLKMGIFFRDLHRNIHRIHSEQLKVKQESTPTIVYRGKTMSKLDFETKIKQGGLVSFNNFLSTSTDRNVALEFISMRLDFSNDVGILFTMIIDGSISSAPFAQIDKLSYSYTEKEILSLCTQFFELNEFKRSNMIL